MDEQFSALFPLPSCVMPGLACHANNFVRGVYESIKNFNESHFHYNRLDISIKSVNNQ